MKKIAKIITLLLVLLLSFLSVFACKQDTTPFGGETDIESKIPDTGKKIDSTYKIVISETNDTEIYNAALELQTFIKQSSGIDLEITRDSLIPQENNAPKFSLSDKYLCVGNNKLSEIAGIEYKQSELGLNGYKIITKGNSVFMGGYGSIGTSYSVYTFLEHEVGFRAYTITSVYVDTVTSVPLLDYNLVDVPDIEWRPIGYGIGMATPNKIGVRRLKLNILDECFTGINGVGFHNQLFYLPETTYGTAHPDWYAESKKQLCYTAHGNKTEFDSLVDEAFNQIKALVIKNPNAYMFSFQQMDNTQFCKCSTCLDLAQKYGGYAGSQIILLNAISRKLDEWVLTNSDGVPHDKDIYICGFAYQTTIDAPVVKNSNGEYVPIDESVVCAPHVSMMYAPLQQDILQSLHSQQNATVKENIEKWKILCPNNLTYYLYQANAHNYIFPTGGYKILQDNYQYVADSAKILFDFGQWDQQRTTAFHEFKIYWDSRVMWDNDVSFEQVKLEFFNGVYGDGAKYMLKMFNEVNTWMDYLASKRVINGGVYFGIEQADYWPYEHLTRWQGYIDKAYQAIEPLKTTDLEKYTIISNEINLESIFTRYAMIQFYGFETMTDQELKDAKNSFVADCDKLGIVRYYETIDIKNKIGSWISD